MKITDEAPAAINRIAVLSDRIRAAIMGVMDRRVITEGEAETLYEAAQELYRQADRLKDRVSQAANDDYYAEIAAKIRSKA